MGIYQVLPMESKSRLKNLSKGHFGNNILSSFIKPLNSLLNPFKQAEGIDARRFHASQRQHFPDSLIQNYLLIVY